MFIVNPQPSNLKFTPDPGPIREMLIEQHRKARHEIQELRVELIEAQAARDEYKTACTVLSKDLSDAMLGHKRLHQEKQDLFNENCNLRREVLRLDGGHPRSLEPDYFAAKSEENVMFRLKPHAYQSEKLRGALREVWPKIDIPPVSIKDLVITCNVLDFVRFLIARDTWGAQNSWKDINAHFQKPRTKSGPSHRIDLT